MSLLTNQVELPADCVKLAKHYVLKDRQPDLVVSGINHGSNTSISVLYSGTMSAAIEGALEGLPVYRVQFM
jgi:5'-nucleotidase